MKTASYVLVLWLVMGYGSALSAMPELIIQDDSTATFKKDVAFMVKSLQTMMNLLGDPDVARSDKDVMINQSYLKYFENSKVQIEDDLDPNRDLPLNKDVQAYLQDIVFFYNQITFRFEILEVTKGLNDRDAIYYKVKSKLWIEGKNLYGDEEQRVSDRYLEFSYDPQNASYKIVSIYTTKLSEKEDIATWWNQIDRPWRVYFSSKVFLSPDKSLADYDSLYPTDLTLDTIQWYGLNVGDMVYLPSGDSLRIGTDAFYKSLLKIFETKEIKLTPNDSIISLEPLRKLNDLEKLSLSECLISDLEPLRSALKLQVLNAAGTSIDQIDDLIYLSELLNLDVSNTPVKNGAGLARFKKLVELNLSNTLIKELSGVIELDELQRLNLSGLKKIDFKGLSQLDQLSQLNLSNTLFSDFGLLENMNKLNTLILDHTEFKTLEGIEKVQGLNVLRIENTKIASLQPLENLENLRLVYCDNSDISKDEVQRFIANKPGVLVIYETQALDQWWENLNPQLKQIIKERNDSLPENPDTELLHRIIFTEKVDLSGRSDLKSLEGFQQLINVRTIDLSGTQVSDLTPLKDLNGLIELNLNYTPISDLSALSDHQSLQVLFIENTSISQLEPLINNKSLSWVYADSSKVTTEIVSDFKAKNEATVVYQTDELTQWWLGLPKTWRRFLSKVMALESEPEGCDLQRLVDADSLNISSSTDIQSLKPLARFYRLNSLTLDQINFESLAPVSELGTLVRLKISGCPVSDFTAITSLYNLDYLNLSGTPVAELEFIILLPQLKHLELQATAVNDLKPLSYLKQLEYLDISYTKVKKVKPLSELTKLIVLKCTNTLISEKSLDKLGKGMPGLEIIHY